VYHFIVVFFLLLLLRKHRQVNATNVRQKTICQCSKEKRRRRRRKDEEYARSPFGRWM